jgi:hypothetical protein
VYLSSGSVERITLNKFEAYDNVQRKKDEAEFIERLKKLKKFESTLFYKLIIKPYNKIIRFMTRHVSKFATILLTVSYKIERKLLI